MAKKNTNTKKNGKADKQEESKDLVLSGGFGGDDNLPDYLRNDGEARGSEGIDAQDIVIPRLDVVQSLSPCRKKSDPAYIEGAEEGMLYNSVTRELYGTEVLVVPVIFKKEWCLWKDRDAGGGFRGAYNSAEEANAAAEGLNDAGEGPVEVVDTHQQIVLLVLDGGKRIEEAVISCSRSKMSPSRKWNSLIRMVGGDRFSRVYRCEAIEEDRGKGEYFNYQFTGYGLPSEPLYRQAEKLYEDISGGKIKATMDTNFDEEAAEEEY